MADAVEEIGRRVEAISLALITLEGEDIPALGEMLNHLNAIKTLCRELADERFAFLVAALEQYLEKVVLRQTSDLKPFETGLEHLQTFFRCLRNQVDYDRDLSGVYREMEIAGHADGRGNEPPAVAVRQDGLSGGGRKPEDIKALRDNAFVFDSPRDVGGDEDREIISGFVMESMEGLGAVEVSLMELEQNDGDEESVNSIFRAFHTIKGVSGFLGFMRINHLAHRAENLLDAVRCGDLDIAPPIVDIILDTVDILKKLIEGVQSALETGGAPDIGLDIGPVIARIETARCSPSDEPEGRERLGRILIKQEAVDETQVAAALAEQSASPRKRIGEILVDAGATGAEQINRALKEQKRGGGRKVELQVKVDTAKLDNLVDLTGELVIAQSMLRQHPYILKNMDQGLMHTLNQLSQITSGLQAMTMSLRMVPIKSTFQKMVRLVRDLSRNSGKQVRLTMVGEDTEIDRNVVDELYEPMVHMIRNSVDHGIEPLDERVASGKKNGGEICLKAYHRGGNIVVEISDDGRGLDKRRIVAKARENGLISGEHKLSDEDIYNLIFAPGFSTAASVSSLSGRGVGMDVVKKAIEKLRGRVDIHTEPARGASFIITLPLTLAIIEGMLVRVGDERYVIPALSIIESFRPVKEQYATVEGKGEMILSRGRLIPLLRLANLFGCRCDVEKPWQGLAVTVEYDGKHMCLLLDELLGKEEVVIKSLGGVMRNVKGIAGGAIMGDGRVGLILDMAGIWQLATG